MWYYLHQVGRGYGVTDLGPIYSFPHFVQLGNGIGSDRETMCKGGKNLADLAKSTNYDVTPSDIVSKHLFELTQNLIGKLFGRRGRKRKRNTTARTRRKKKAQPTNKRDIFS